MARKTKRAPYLAPVQKEQPADDLMRIVRIRRFGATDTDWRDQRWETPHGRLAIRGERWERLRPHARAHLEGTREAHWIDRDEFEAAVKYLDMRMAYLRAYGAPGLPWARVGDDAMCCPICGSATRCEPCAANFQHQITEAMQDCWRTIDSASVVARFPLKSAIDHMLTNSAESATFLPEEELPHLVKPLRVALRALHELFLGNVDRFGTALLTARLMRENLVNDKVVVA